ncbi:LysR family transcriptional regulator [Salinicola sp. JS01]|uniref:LysR family transcriptional regulator n=1 Tax=Salinicola sp. JS01 TaxID=3050071 RepID=UPI00255C083C|nr:LysR family transcriptional regulator [Salinicola sp. JS01]WIX34919.1 LysR family transcriptional regulator [Salinicola sp. JS01]
MLRENMTGLVAFATVARAGTFTKAAAQLGVSQSALSHTVRDLEERLGIKVLARTTRKVAPTVEGQRLLDRVVPMLDELERELWSIIDTRDNPAGNFRITTTDYAANTLVWPKLRPVLSQYPDIHVEVVTEYQLTDIVESQFDAGIRLGEQVSEGMIAVRVGPDFAMRAVASPDYFRVHGRPQTPQELTQHRCINLRLPTHGGLYAWEFEKEGREVRVKVEGQLTFNTIDPVLTAAMDGYGIGYVPDGLAADAIAAGKLEAVLEAWSPPFTGYFLYYPHRRQSSPAFSILVNALSQQ